MVNSVISLPYIVKIRVANSRNFLQFVNIIIHTLIYITPLIC